MSGRRYHTPNGEPWRVANATGRRSVRVDIVDAQGATVAAGLDPETAEHIVACVNALVNRKPEALAMLLAEVDQMADLQACDFDELNALLDSFNATPTEDQQGA